MDLHNRTVHSQLSSFKFVLSARFFFKIRNTHNQAHLVTSTLRKYPKDLPLYVKNAMKHLMFDVFYSNYTRYSQAKLFSFISNVKYVVPFFPFQKVCILTIKQTYDKHQTEFHPQFYTPPP